MNGQKEIVEMMEKNGFVTRSEAARIVGRADGGNIPKVMTKYGVRCVRIGEDENGIVRLMYKRDDLLKVPSPAKEDSQLSLIPGGDSNGGKIRHEINTMKSLLAEIETRIMKLEAFKSKFD